MNASDLIVVTGAAGFIGSVLVGYLNQQGFENLLLVDDFSDARKSPNLENRKYARLIEREHFFEIVDAEKLPIDCFFHLGARTDTTEMDYEVHRHLNLEYSIKVWKLCTASSIPLVYASSAATYGNGEHGYVDSHEVVAQLAPLNPYGVSKNEFDKWALAQKTSPPFWSGLKFFNVYGPGEYHKGRMASVIFHAFNTIQSGKPVRLFRSHNPAYKDGEQQRDFIYVKDVVSICYWLMQSHPQSGLYNTGTGQARTFNDLVKAIYAALEKHPEIGYIDTPVDIRDKYQYFTEADMTKLEVAGYSTPFWSLEDGVKDYVRNYLLHSAYF
jgi:ADP-L-glycero-D-manno-heptose 6-epimerase